MSELDVRIVEIEPMRVASVYGFGKEPEGLAHDKLQAWAKPKGYLGDPEHHRVFGFNNPNPSPSSPNYGYELWIAVDPTVEPEGDVRIMDFKGGLYAVTRCVIRGDQYDVIGATWKKLGMWCEDSKYQFASHQWLEEHLLAEDTPEGDWALDLYMPIAE